MRRSRKPHIHRRCTGDEILGGWYVWDPLGGLSLGPYHWAGVQLVASSCWRGLQERG